MKAADAKRYDHKTIEAKWQKVWLDTRLDVIDLDRAEKPFGQTQGKPFYNLMMFPYPSAEGLHVGNMYAFTGSDIYGRFKRMQGYTVFEPIGLDGFGIHSENYALKVGRHPQEHAKITQRRFYEQLHKIGAMYDWSRTVETYDPAYYRWTQWIFLQMFKHGLAYRGKAQVNWCPNDKTVLADEQVIDGRCERCGNLVEKRQLEQWFFKITAYAEKLLKNIDRLDWSEKVKIAQKNWIGKKIGTLITWQIPGQGVIETLTTRPDTLYGVTFIALAPDHPKAQSLSESGRARDYRVEALKTVKSGLKTRAAVKTGVNTGFSAIHPLTGEKIPIWLADYVLGEVGTGAIMGVPAHDSRDFAFAKKYGLEIREVVSPTGQPQGALVASCEDWGILLNSGKYSGLTSERAIKAITQELTQRKLGKPSVQYHLRDWLISRQRYWGPPIPMIYCQKCAKEGKSWFTMSEAAEVANKNFGPSSEVARKGGSDPRVKIEAGQNFVGSPQLRFSMVGWYPVPEDKLPVKLPYIKDYKPGDDGVAPLAKHKEFYETTCPGCGSQAVRETDVSDTFLDSSWYFFRYTSTDDNTCPWKPERAKKWLPVKMYTGGAEHSVLHLMYARFVTMAFHDWGLISHFEEPFTHFYAHGLVIKEGAKMSKSKGNVVTPDEYIDLYGADALRLYLMFMGPFDQGGDFRDTAMEGMARWVGRVWRLAQAPAQASSDQVARALNRLIKKVGEDIEKRRYNTAIAAMMEFTNLVGEQGGKLGLTELKKFILILAPFAPYLAEELWQRTNLPAAEVANENFGPSSEVARKGTLKRAVKIESGQNFVGSPPAFSRLDSVHLQPWPTFESKLIAGESVKVIVQVNGKLRETLAVSSEKAKTQTEIEAAARASEKVEKYLSSGKITKIIFVPGRLINFVIS